MTNEQETQSVKVLVVDDQHLIRDGIVSLLSIQDHIQVVGMAANGQEAIEKALECQPDVILMDIRMPGMDGIAATEQLRQQLAGTKILMLTTFDDEELILASLKAGAVGYILKNIPAGDLATAIHMAHRGIYQLAPDAANKLIEFIKQENDTHPNRPSGHVSPHQYLTERELEVLFLIAKGATNREIADKLFITEGTVKSHVSNILGQLGLRDRTQAAIYAHEHGLCGLSNNGGEGNC